MELPALVSRYAERFAALGRGEHHVGSPLGRLAGARARRAGGERAEQITDALGIDADTAHRVATDVLTHLHAAVPRRRPGRSRACPGLDGWRVGLPATVANGPAARPGPDLARPDDRAASSCRAARPPPTDQLGPSAGFDLQVGTRWLNFRAGIAILGAWRSGGSTARST
jgi:hypothetical protein